MTGHGPKGIKRLDLDRIHMNIMEKYKDEDCNISAQP